jgi:hypothetical protein
MAEKRGDRESALERLMTRLVRSRVRALRDELTRPWQRGRRTPEAEAGRWFGLGLAVGTAVVGAGLALYVVLREGS